MGTIEVIRYSPFFRRIFSLIKNLRKGKFKSLYRRFTDPKYAADIKHLWKVTGEYEWQVTEAYIPLHWVHHSHDINYHEWVDHLVKKLESQSILEPMKVVYDRYKQCWIVADGNHRLAAANRKYKSTEAAPFMIGVKVLHRKGTQLWYEHPSLRPTKEIEFMEVQA